MKRIILDELLEPMGVGIHRLIENGPISKYNGPAEIIPEYLRLRILALNGLLQ